MKKKLTIILAVLLTLSVITIAVGSQWKPYAFPLVGKWQPARDPLLIDEYGWQDIQNMRKADGNRLKGVSGHSAINDTIWNSTNKYPKNGFHFRKYNPAESHVIISGAATNDTAHKLFQNITAIPDAGDFATTAEILFTEDASAGLGRYADAPQGNVVLTNGIESLIWGGDELIVAGFDVYNPDGSFTYNYWEQVSNTLTSAGNVATITPSDATIDAETLLLLHCDLADGVSTFEDAGATTHVLTTVGTAEHDTAYKKFGAASGLFDGTTGYLTAADHADWTIGTAEYTIDTWIKLGDTAEDVTILSHYTDNGNYWDFLVETDGTLKYFYLAATSSENTIEVESPAGEISAGVEYHIAYSRDDAGVSYLFINGELKASSAAQTPGTPDTVANLTDVLTVGANLETGTGEFFDGWLDELRFTNGSAKWTSNFEPPTSAYSGTGKAYMHLGSPRPLQGFKAYIGTANTAASTMAVFYWNGASWTAVAALVDNTDTGASLAATGTVTFTSTVGSAKPKFLNGLQLYWYKIEIDACDSTTTITHVTLDAPFQAMTNLWDGNYQALVSAYIYKESTYRDWTDELQSDDSTYFALLDSLATSESLLLGFMEPQQGFNLKMVATEENINIAVLSVNYWSGAAWTSVSGLTDGTSNDGKSLNKSGVISFEPVSPGSGFEREIEQEIPLYWYQLKWDAALDGTTQIYFAEGIPAPDAIVGYTFPALFQGRTFLFNEPSGARNRGIYSAYNVPYVFNGSDSGDLYFGKGSDVVASATIYNLYQTSGLDQLIVFKHNETWRLFGDGPENWEQQQMSGNVGCIAPLSVAVAEVSDIYEGVKRHVVLWQSAHGVYRSDGATVDRISDDIANYWDPNSDDYIPAARMGASDGWYDPNLQSYKLLISSGTGQTTHNVELEYSLKYEEWTKLYRDAGQATADPLQIGFPVIDTTGNVYTYGATNNGYLYRLEHGSMWDGGVAIAQYVHTKDMMLDDQAPFFKSTIIKYFRMIYVPVTGSGEVASVVIEHYCDGTATTDGSNNQAEPEDVDLTAGDNQSTQDVNLGPCKKHSFKLSTSPTNVTDGFQLNGLGFIYDPLKVIQE